MSEFKFPEKFEFKKGSLSHIEKCFIIGNGPTLNKFNLDKLSDELTIGVNHILRSGFSPSIICISDMRVIKENIDFELLKSTKSKLVIGKHVANKFINENKFSNNNIHKTFNLNANPVFSHNYINLWKGDLEETRCIGSVIGDICIPLSVYLGIKNIFLIGVDEYWDLINIKNTHFFDRVVTEQEKSFIRCSKMRNIWFGRQDLLARQQGVRIRNLSPGSALRAFERADPNILFPSIVNKNKIDAIGKFINFKGELYKVVKANNGDISACSLKKIKDNKYIRHYKGEVIDSYSNLNTNIFDDDSSFFAETSFVDINKLSFLSSNLKNLYITRDIYLEKYHMHSFKADFIPYESSFEIYDCG